MDCYNKLELSLDSYKSDKVENSLIRLIISIIEKQVLQPVKYLEFFLITFSK